MHRRGLTPVLLVALALGACGEDAPSQARTAADAVNLRVTVSDGEGTVRRARLRCGDGTASGSGFLRRRARQHCRTARRLAAFLASEPDRNRPCTELYGGPQTAVVRGRIGNRAVDRRLTRRDGCEIADWERAKPLLAPSGIRPGAFA